MATQLTKTEFLNKYGTTKVKFAAYSKFKFSFKAETPESSILVWVGGNSSDAYDLEIDADTFESINCINPTNGVVYMNGEEVEWFN